MPHHGQGGRLSERYCVGIIEKFDVMSKMLYTVVKEKQRTERAAVAGWSKDLSRRCRNRHPAYSRMRKRDYSDVAPLLLLHDVSDRTIRRRAGGVCRVKTVVKATIRSGFR